jgi:hypothetical protein
LLSLSKLLDALYAPIWLEFHSRFQNCYRLIH